MLLTHTKWKQKRTKLFSFMVKNMGLTCISKTQDTKKALLFVEDKVKTYIKL